MKKILMICILSLAMVTMISCGKDNEELIVGNWRIQSYENFHEGLSVNPYPPNQIEYVDNWGWVFNSDGSGHSYEISDGSENIIAQLTYSITEDSLIIRYDNGFQTKWGIESLNRRKLRISTPRMEVTDEEGNFLRYETGYLNFKKQ